MLGKIFEVFVIGILYLTVFGFSEITGATCGLPGNSCVFLENGLVIGFVWLFVGLVFYANNTFTGKKYFHPLFLPPIVIVVYIAILFISHGLDKL